MKAHPTTSGLLAERIVNSDGATAWFLIEAEAEEASEIAAIIVEELHSRCFRARLESPATTEAFFETLSNSSLASPLIVCVPSELTPPDWIPIDLARDHVRTGRTTVLVLSWDQLGALNVNAPNLASFATGNVFSVTSREGESSHADIESRLAALRQKAGFCDEELVRRWLAGTAPAEPWVADWLVLMGRSELLAPRG